MSRTTGVLALLLLASTGCLMSMSTSKTVTSPEDRIPVPDKYPKADQPPALVDCEVDGCKRAQELDPNLYYCAKEEHWFRWSMNRWYLAFAWDGNWFPTLKTDLPASLVAITPKPEEVKKSRDERLKQLDQQLETIDKDANTDTSREDKLKELDKKLKEIEEQEKAQGAH